MRKLEIGIYDDLDSQKQPLLNVDVYSNNIMIFGGHRSGKTTLLKTMLVRMHERISENDVEEIYIIDFGGNLGEYEKLPLVAACFDSSNEENIRRVFRTVENNLESNIKDLHSVQFHEAYAEAREKKPRHITLIIDNINSFLADDRYTAYQEVLLKFCRDGLSKGLSLIFTASEIANGLGRFLSGFETKFAFEVPNEMYVEIFGMKVSEVMKYAGRGISIVDGKPREFQAFLPFENERRDFPLAVEEFSHLKNKVEKLAAFRGELTKENFSEFSRGRVQIEDILVEKDAIVVGLDYYEHSPITIDLTETHSIAIYGKKKFGKTNLLHLILDSIREKHSDYIMVFLDDGREQLKEFYTKNQEHSIYTKKLDEMEYILENLPFSINHFNEDNLQPLPPQDEPELPDPRQLRNAPGLPDPRQLRNAPGLPDPRQLRNVPEIQNPIQPQEILEPQPVQNLPEIPEIDQVPEPENVAVVFIMQNKTMFQSAGNNLIRIIADTISKAEENRHYFIFSDVKKCNDRDVEVIMNNSFSVAFLLDNIAEFVSDRGNHSVFGEMDAKELKTEYARCELGDGYFFDIESDELKKTKFLKA